MTGRFFNHMWRSGRIVVPADGWFEWTVEDGKKQPWFIRLKGGRPLFMAGITNWIPYKQGPEGTGFVLVSSQAEGGMIDIHARTPVVFDADDARRWIDPALTPQEAHDCATQAAIRADGFEWYKVSRDANSAANNEKHIIQPLPPG